MSRVVASIILAALPAWLPQSAAAQFGLYQLPNNNFIWRWGDAREGRARGAPDIEITGTESAFNCELTAALRPSTNMSMSEIRDLEMNLRTRLDFIYAATTTMNYLDQNLNLDWATLDCKKPEPGPRDEAASKAREDAAREKMLRELERRRARQQRDE